MLQSRKEPRAFCYVEKENWFYRKSISLFLSNKLQKLYEFGNEKEFTSKYGENMKTSAKQ